MKLTWYGHSCFLITTSNGKRILIDPFNDSIGYNTNFSQADIIVLTHNHFDHCFLKNINENIQIINSVGTYDLEFAYIEGIKTFHDKYNGLKRGENILYIFEIDNLKICHLGDLGHALPQSILEKLYDTDILFIPIGGHITLNGIEASKVSNLICPKYVIPMHYKTFKSSLYLDDAKNFILSMNDVEKINSNIIDTDNLNFKDKNKVLFLSPPLN